VYPRFSSVCVLRRVCRGRVKHIVGLLGCRQSRDTMYVKIQLQFFLIMILSFEVWLSFYINPNSKALTDSFQNFTFFTLTQ
jgi:hypothetical protein